MVNQATQPLSFLTVMLSLYSDEPVRAYDFLWLINYPIYTYP